MITNDGEFDLPVEREKLIWSLHLPGHAILREIDAQHPAAKSIIELARTQDEEVGDGTTTVIILGIASKLGYSAQY